MPRRHIPLRADQVARLLFDNAQRKAEKRKKSFNLKFDDVYDRVRHGRCERTGLPFDMRKGANLPFRASLDRIDNARGYEPDNIQVVVRIYNTAKWGWTDDDVLKVSRALVLMAGTSDDDDDPHGLRALLYPDYSGDDANVEDIPEGVELPGRQNVVALADSLKPAEKQV